RSRPSSTRSTSSRTPAPSARRGWSTSRWPSDSWPWSASEPGSGSSAGSDARESVPDTFGEPPRRPVASTIGITTMNFRLSAILFGVIFVAGLVLLVLSFTGDDKPPTTTLLEELAGLKPAEIDAVEFERDGGSRFKIVRDPSNTARWNIVEPYTARADAGA